MVDAKHKAARFSGVLTCILVAILISVKAIAYISTGSASILASLVDNIADFLMSILSFLAVIYSLKPADDDHRSGHGKIEGLFAMLQSAVMILGGVVVAYQGVLALLMGGRVIDLSGENAVVAIGVIIFSLCMTRLISYLQSRAVQATGSLAIESDHAHYSVDTVQNILILTVLGAIYFGAPSYIDGICAVLISLWMGWNALTVARNGIDMVLDRELAKEQRQQILDIVNNHDKVLGVHDLRATRSGMKELIFFDIEASPAMSVEEAHDITRDLERGILRLFPSAEIMIHVDPAGDISDSRHTVAAVHHK